MRAYALVELGDSESIDLFLREEDARRALEGMLLEEPDWTGQFYIQPVELTGERFVGELAGADVVFRGSGSGDRNGDMAAKVVAVGVVLVVLYVFFVLVSLFPGARALLAAVGCSAV